MTLAKLRKIDLMSLSYRCTLSPNGLSSLMSRNALRMICWYRGSALITQHLLIVTTMSKETPWWPWRTHTKHWGSRWLHRRTAVNGATGAHVAKRIGLPTITTCASWMKTSTSALTIIESPRRVTPQAWTSLSLARATCSGVAWTVVK